MRGEVLPLDPEDKQLEGVQQALLAAASAEKDGGPLGAMARTLGRLPYRTADQVSRTDAFLRSALELSRQLDRHAAETARVEACAAVELMARLQPKLFAIPSETLDALRAIATANTPTVKRTELVLRTTALQALVAVRRG